jgi:hypothetical protein
MDTNSFILCNSFELIESFLVGDAFDLILPSRQAMLEVVPGHLLANRLAIKIKVGFAHDVQSKSPNIARPGKTTTNLSSTLLLLAILR